MSALPRHFCTEGEYLELESRTDYKSQYVGGEIFAMAGAEPEHIEIADNLTILFGSLLREKPCRSYSGDLRVRVRPASLWTYPDLTVVCGEAQYDTSAKPRSLLNPQVIFEILSPSTEAFDRGDKFARYRLIESLADYVLVSSDRVRVEHFVRQPEGLWFFREYHRLEERLPLHSLGCELPLSGIYDRVTFPSAI